MALITKSIGWADKFAVSASTICALHCIGLPFALSVFPAIGSTIFGDEAFHVWLLWAVVPLSAVSLFVGCRRHKNSTVLVLGALGIAILIFAAFAGHDLIGETGERLVTLLGAGLVGLAHIRNYKLCRHSDCDH